jgi:signal peptidase I
MKRYLTTLLMVLVLLQTGCGGNGDRVLVAKYMYDPNLGSPERYDVVVFRYPESPLKGGVPTNYIKRLLGLAAETIAIFFGQLYVTTEFKQPANDKEAEPLELWRKQYTHVNEAEDLFKQGKFDILRKPPKVMLAMRRLVYDNDHQASKLKNVLEPRWKTEGSKWSVINETGFVHTGAIKDLDWLRYQHILPKGWSADTGPDNKGKEKPQLITDFMSYNSQAANTEHWVGSLMLELELKVEQGQGEFWLELAKGVDRFQARWDLSNGVCQLVRIQRDKEERDKEELLEKKETVARGPGTYQIRFANFDERLTVWVNQSLPFGDGVSYPRAWKYDREKNRWENAGPREKTDLKPANIASKAAAVQIHHLRLWRDTYYTIPPAERGKDAYPFPKSDSKVYESLNGDGLSNSSSWEVLEDADKMPVGTMFVQPGHYLCLGDNSGQSSDGRTWGLVPERLMLGRALVVYYPFYFPYAPVNSDYNRVGVIH